MKRELADGYALRFATVGEGAALADLVTRAGSPIPAESLDLLAAERRVFVAETEAEVVGVAALGERQGALAIESLGVLQGHRGRGIGSALVTSVEEFGRWAFFPMVVVAAEDAAAAFLFRRGYLAADGARLPGAMAGLGTGAPILAKRL